MPSTLCVTDMISVIAVYDDSSLMLYMLGLLQLELSILNC